MQFENEQEIIDYLSAHLQRSGMHASLSRQVAQEMTPLVQESVRKGRVFGRLLSTKLVIRDDDLKLLDFICTGLGIGALAATGGPLLAVGTAVVVATLKLIYAIVKKGATITSVQHKIILALKAQQGSTVEGILDWLQRSYKEQEWNQRMVEDGLRSLESLPLKDGNIVKLVNKTEDGLWYVAGA